MGLVKQMWIDEVDRIYEQLEDGEIDRDTAVAEFRGKGFLKDEAEDMADSVEEV